MDRERLSGHSAHVIWLTGLSGSGKSTIARQLEIALIARNRRTFVLDGDNLRSGLCKDLGYSLTDRAENVRRVAEVAKILLDAGVISIVALISPIEEQRQLARQLIGAENVTIVHLATPLATCMQRDPKGLFSEGSDRRDSTHDGN